jgi:hypothetical protein
MVNQTDEVADTHHHLDNGVESKQLTLVSEAGTEFEALDQLGPTVQSVIKSGRQDMFLEQLGVFIRKKEIDIELLCNQHYQARGVYAL